MGLLAFLLRAILFLFVFRLAGIVLRAFLGGFLQGARPAGQANSGQAAPDRGGPATGGRIEELVKDPVCGIHTARSQAIAGYFQGREAFFCSEACASKAHLQI